MAEVTYEKTSIGQLLYDLAFTNSTAKWLARKHRLPIANIRNMRGKPEIKKLRRKNRLPAICR